VIKYESPNAPDARAHLKTQQQHTTVVNTIQINGKTINATKIRIAITQEFNKFFFLF